MRKKKSGSKNIREQSKCLNYNKKRKTCRDYVFFSFCLWITDISLEEYIDIEKSVGQEVQRCDGIEKRNMSIS